MIVTCAACQTRYRIDEHELGGAGGRDVRCTNCGHVWRQTASVEAPAGEAAPNIAPPPNEGAVAEPDRSPPPSLAAPSRLSSPSSPPAPLVRHRSAGFGRVMVVILALLVVVAALAAIIGRHQLSAAWPPAQRLFASIGLPVEPAETGLQIGKVAPARSGDALVIAGEIVNLGTAPQEVPRLRVALRDAAEKEIQFEVADPPKAQLQPGEVEHFSIPIAHPVEAATGVVVTFANP